MKILRSVLLLALLPAVTLAQTAEAERGQGASPRPPGELAALEQFLNLSDDELAQMEKVIARLRSMTPAERAQLREKMVEFRRMPEPQRRHLRQGWGALPPDLQDAWRKMMLSATPERRAEIQTKLQSLRPEEKGAYRKRLAEEYQAQQAAKE